MEQNKMTKWVAGEPTNSATGIFIKDTDGKSILRVYSYPGGRSDDIEKVTRAINGTYGCGVNPDAIKDLVESVNKMRHYAERYLAAATIPELYDMCFEDIKFVEAAMLKAQTL